MENHLYTHVLASSATGRRFLSQNHLDSKTKKTIDMAFSYADEGKKGYLTRCDFKVACLYVLGFKPPKYETAKVFEKCEQDKLLHADFVEYMKSKLIYEDFDENMRQLFIMFDCRCRGYITKEDLSYIVDEIAPYVHPYVVNQMFSVADQDGDGRVSYSDFISTMRLRFD
eukprot:Nk52_evm53s1810 gene=Nk52_evmTU53s1810